MAYANILISPLVKYYDLFATKQPVVLFHSNLFKLKMLLITTDQMQKRLDFE